MAPQRIMPAALACLAILLVAAPTQHGAASGSDRDSSSGVVSEDTIVDGYRPHCEGKGTRYCYRPWAEPCPSACAMLCGHSSEDESSSEGYGGIREDLRRALNSRLFDQAFVHNGDSLCVANCKHGSTGCAKWARFRGKKYCQALACGKIDGCHADKDFVPLTCFLCVRAFPKCWARDM